MWYEYIYIPQGPIGTQISAHLGFDTLFGGAHFSGFWPLLDHASENCFSGTFKARLEFWTTSQPSQAFEVLRSYCGPVIYNYVHPSLVCLVHRGIQFRFWCVCLQYYKTLAYRGFCAWPVPNICRVQFGHNSVLLGYPVGVRHMVRSWTQCRSATQVSWFTSTFGCVRFKERFSCS